MTYLKKNFLIILTLILAALTRFYRIGDYMVFLGDEGRDMLVAKHMLEGDLTLLGPRASAGDFFLGPIYYYFITPFLWLFNYDPVGPAIFVAIVGIATVYLVYWTGTKFFGKEAGLFAAALYAVAPVVVRYSMSSWNPNVVPFFTLLTIIFLYFSIKKRSLIYAGVVGLLLGVLMQLHYLSTFIAVIVAAAVLIGNIYTFSFKSFANWIKTSIIQYLLIFSGFLVTFSPFIAFEIRHGFPNIRSIFSFIFSSEQNSNLGERPTFISIVVDVFHRVFTNVFVYVSEDSSWNSVIENGLYVVIFILAASSVFILKNNKNKLFMLLLSLWLVLGIVLFGFYKKPLYEYYFGFLFPVPFLMIGATLQYLFNKNMPRKLLAIGLFAIFMIVNISQLHVWHEPNRQKVQMQNIAEFVLSKTNNEPFNFALLAEGNSDHAYRYFFEVNEQPPVTIENEDNDPERETVTNQLLVVCEQKCDPIGHPLWEIAGFGLAEVEGEWDVSVVKVYKLIHTDSS